MKNYSKIFKLLMLVLIIVSVIVLLAGSIVGFESKGGQAVDWLLVWAYIMVVLAILAIVVVGLIISYKNNPKSVVKLGIGIVAIAVFCLVVYLLSPGSEAINLLVDQPDHGTLKLVDTVLNLTYIAAGAAIVSIIAGEIIASVRNKQASK